MTNDNPGIAGAIAEINRRFAYPSREVAARPAMPDRERIILLRATLEGVLAMAKMESERSNAWRNMVWTITDTLEETK